MNSTTSRYTAYTAAIILALCISITAQAQTDASVDASVSTSNASGTVNVENRGVIPRAKAVPGQVRQELELRKDLNKDLRNKIIDEKKEETTRARADFKASSTELRTDMRAEMRSASSSEARREAVRGAQAERRELLASMKKDVFAARQKALTAQLEVTLDNLVKVKAKIAEHIARLKADGKDIANIEALVAKVDVKIEAARVAIKAVATYTPPAPAATANASSSAEIALTKPREMGNAAIAALKEVRDALKDVYDALKPHLQVRAEGRGEVRATATTNITN